MKNLSNHVIIITSCQTNKTELKSLPISSDHHHYYYYFSSQSSLPLSFSSSSSSLNLFYCEQQQTSYYLSSGFSILHSFPRLLSINIIKNKHSLSFNQYDDIISNINQSSSSSTIDNNNLISTTIPPTTTIVGLSNITLLHPSLSIIETSNRLFFIMLIIGCIIIGIILIFIIYIIMKCFNRNEGSYKIDESINFSTKSHMDNLNINNCTGKISSSNNQKFLLTNEQNIIDSKEWYV